jgi:hypothetical protein
MRYIYLLAFTLFSFCAYSQQDTAVSAPANTSHLRISILTCGVGDELYSSFGHTGVRIIDSVKHTDEVYNYGTFNFSPDFYKEFVRGKLLYYLDKSSFNDFMSTYVEEKRNVQEQVLDIPEDRKSAIFVYLENNLLPENKSYKYDYFFDNCATRVRDIFPKVLGPEFYFGEVLHGKKISYRKIMNQYLVNKHWERFGMNLLLASPTDSIMTDEGGMFLPDFIHQGLVHAKYRGNHVVSSDATILDHKHVFKSTLNGPLWAMIGLLILTALSFLVRSFHYLKSVLRFLILMVTGLLGILMLVMWLGTDHRACSNNYNILWAIPFNTIIAFVAHKKRFWLKIYALAAISLLIVALAVHLIGFQQLPLIELSPLLLCLMYVYIDMYKQNVHTPVPNSEPGQQQQTIR